MRSSVKLVLYMGWMMMAIGNSAWSVDMSIVNVMNNSGQSAVLTPRL